MRTGRSDSTLGFSYLMRIVSKRPRMTERSANTSGRVFKPTK